MTEEKVKYGLKATFLGFEEVEYTNFITGEITTKEAVSGQSNVVIRDDGC